MTKLLTYIQIDESLEGFVSVNETLKKAEGLRIKSAREAKGYSLTKVYKETNIQIKTLKNIEKGQKSIGQDTINKLKLFLGMISVEEVKKAEMLANGKI
jgi:ribosome-binding protein aMBF1 (putative translation factor)